MSGDNLSSKQPASPRIACVATAAGHAGGAAIAMQVLANTTAAAVSRTP